MSQHSHQGWSRRGFLGASGAAAGLGLLGGGSWLPARRAFAADGKTGSTYYTAEKVANARANVTRYQWARAIRDKAVAAAQSLAQLSDDALWSLVPSQTVGRSLGVLIRYQARILGAPGAQQGGVGNGSAINSYGSYPWVIDHFDHPWKIKNPANGEFYPSNDFASFYAAGLDDHGVFDPILARTKGSQYLVNELYPERGAGWGVDDGSGWRDPAGNVWTFVAYYCHWGLWYGAGIANYGLLQGGLKALYDSYLYTGDATYAHKGLVLLDRIADVYPAMDVTAFRWQDGFDNGDPNVHTAQGKTVNDIWETGVASNLIQAYDAFWPAIDNDPELLAFLKEKALQYGISTPKSSAAELRNHIEDHIVRLVLPAVKSSQIRGNTGMHHATLALAAVVLDRAGESNEILDYCFQTGALVKVPGNQYPYGRQYQVTGGDLARLFIDAVDRDGSGNEAAPGYNTLWLNSLMPMADALARYQRYPDFDLYGNVKFASMFTAIAPIVMLGRYTPSIGDSGNTGGPGIIGSLETSVAGFVQDPQPKLAQLIGLLSQGDVSAVQGTIFESEPEAVRDQVSAMIDEYGLLSDRTQHMTGYGFSGLRQGSGDQARALWMYYGRSVGHGHLDCLNLGVYGAGMDLAPDLGYPEVTGNDPERLNWTAATIAHNTVVVDEASQLPQWVGTPILLGESDWVSLAEVRSTKAYPQLADYRRMTAMIKVGEQVSYAVDFFRVTGGSSHVFSFHGGPGEVSTSGLSLLPQKTGTYAGPEVSFRDASYNTVRRSGYNYLNNVVRDTAPRATWSVDWAVTDQWQVHSSDPKAHLRLTMLSPVSEVALADGTPPRNKPGNPGPLRYVLARRAGTNLSSTFTSVIEPYLASSDSAAPAVRSSRLASVAGNPSPDAMTAVRIELADGRVDYVVWAMDSSRSFIIDSQIKFQGRFGWIRLHQGRVEHRYQIDAVTLDLLTNATAVATPRLTGTVRSFTSTLSLDNELTIVADTEIARKVNQEQLVGSWIYVDNDGERNASYRIEEALVVGDRLRLGLGRQTLIRSLLDPTDANGGYRYDVALGARCRIPLSYEG